MGSGVRVPPSALRKGLAFAGLFAVPRANRRWLIGPGSASWAVFGPYEIPQQRAAGGSDLRVGADPRSVTKFGDDVRVGRQRRGRVVAHLRRDVDDRGRPSWIKSSAPSCHPTPLSLRTLRLHHPRSTVHPVSPPTAFLCRDPVFIEGWVWIRNPYPGPHRSPESRPPGSVPRAVRARDGTPADDHRSDGTGGLVSGVDAGPGRLRPMRRRALGFTPWWRRKTLANCGEWP
jgi:hypothetical protein